MAEPDPVFSGRFVVIIEYSDCLGHSRTAAATQSEEDAKLLFSMASHAADLFEDDLLRTGSKML